VTLAVIATLALGIGANTAIFSLVDGVWLRPAEIRDPAHLVELKSVKSQATADAEQEANFSFAEYRDIEARASSFGQMAAVSGRGVVLDRGDGLRMLIARVVSENYFEVIGARTALGRLPSRQEMYSTDAPAMMLSYAAWKTIFNGDPAAVGQTVKLAQGSARVVGVLEPGFRGTDRMLDPQVYVSQTAWLVWHPDERNAPRGDRKFSVYARLRPGATMEQARSQLRGIAGQLAAAYPESNSGLSMTADWESKSVELPQIRMLSLLLLALAAAVLLIACVNILNLLLARNDARRREFAMRVALGAGRGDLLGQLLMETCLLAAVALGAALLLAQRLVALVPALMPQIGYPLGFDFRMDGRVLAFAAVSGVVTLLVCGLAPGLASSRVAPLEAMRSGTPANGRLKMPARKIFVVAQLTASMALLTATALLVRTLWHIQSMDMGFRQAENAVLINLSPSQDGPRRLAEFAQWKDRVRALPGVQDVSVARVVPFPENGGGATKLLLKPGEPVTATAGSPVLFNSVDEEYFRAMGVTLVRGRNFGGQDAPDGPRVAIVNQTLAIKLFGTEDAVGRHFRIGRMHPVDVEVAGVARDGKYSDPTETPQPYLFLPLRQEPSGEVMLIVTTAADPKTLVAEVRRAVVKDDPRVLIMSAQTLTDHMHLQTYANRMAAWLTAALGGLALLLTAVGLYGVTAYAVSRRTREIGIRVALGAGRAQVAGPVLREGLTLSLIGLALGAALAVGLGRAIEGMLYGVKAFDPVALGAVAALMLAVSLAALAGPARRALAIDPVRALKEE
jgi:predicted permease